MNEEKDTNTAIEKGSWTGIIIVVIIIALGGAYFWYVQSGALQKLDTRNKALRNQTASPADLFAEFNATGNADVSKDIKKIDTTLK